jgi:hypothetical protein
MSNNMINTHKPISMASLKQFREGWNAASKGTLITQNPYPEDHAPMASWNLWTNGYNDYMASSYNCIAHNFYHQFGADKTPYEQMQIGVVVERDTQEDFTITRYTFGDGSAVVITPSLMHIEDKKGECFITVPWMKAANT